MMPANRSKYDLKVALAVLLVFTLPLTLLIPDFSIWEFVPRYRVNRYLLISQKVTWKQLNTVLLLLTFLFFCMYLEIRKRKLDDFVESILAASQATDKTMETEQERQKNTMRICVDLLDSSADHYEQLMLLRDELRKRTKIHQPPTIEPSSEVKVNPSNKIK